MSFSPHPRYNDDPSLPPLALTALRRVLEYDAVVSTYCTVFSVLYALYCTHCHVLARTTLHCTHYTALYALYCTVSHRLAFCFNSMYDNTSQYKTKQSLTSHHLTSPHVHYTARVERTYEETPWEGEDVFRGEGHRPSGGSQDA
jgi:hypothetical protein